MSDLTQSLQAQVASAFNERRPFNVTSGNSKAFYGREPSGDPLDVSGHQGIISYEPSELVITARCGTPLAEIETRLHERGQMLAFEPPHFGDSATLGGTIACGFSGPRRPYAGAARDFVLGTQVLTGKGEVLRFGGEVMKNVAGYDVSRLMVGALGALGVVLEVSLKVLPCPEQEKTLVRETGLANALRLMNEWAGQPLPLSATAFYEDRLYVRLSGTEAGVKAALQKLGGDEVGDGQQFWYSLREQTHPFFQRNDCSLWRIAVPATAPTLTLKGAQLIEWGGAQRWFFTDSPVDVVQKIATNAGGHATLFRYGDRNLSFTPLSPTVLSLHQNLKHAFDPHGIMNPGRMYRTLQ